MDVITNSVWMGLQAWKSATVYNRPHWRGVLHFINVGKMELRNGRRRYQWTDVWSFWLGAGDFWNRKGLRKVKISDWWSVTPDWERLQGGGIWHQEGWMCGGSGLDSGSCEYLGRALDNLDTCHHPNKGQILTTVVNIMSLYILTGWWLHLT